MTDDLPRYALPAEGDDLRELVRGLTLDELYELVEDMPAATVEALLSEVSDGGRSLPGTPIGMSEDVEEAFAVRPHLQYLSDRITKALTDVEAGVSRKIVVQMPPRAGKTTLATKLTAGWIMAKHPTWPIALTSHDGGLATSWGRAIRRWAEQGRLGDGVQLAADAGAASSWETTEGGKLLSISIRESFTGRGAKVLVIDDPHKDYVDAHSKQMRDNVWGWWLSVAQTRLEPPSLVIVTMTRWHEDDFVGRLLSKDYEGDPEEWEVIRFPAVAEESDVLGRSEGEPLYSPLLNESESQALERWTAVRRSVGEYVWSAMYQQRPSPSKGSIFDMDSLRFWTSDPDAATEDGRVRYFDPEAASGGQWVDSWDTAFKATESSDFVVGQRWVRLGANRFLIAQQRGRRTFTQTVAWLKDWAKPDNPVASPYGHLVHTRLVEEAANGAAIIDTLRDKVAGIKPIKAVVGKEARARAITPEVESGNVYLPLPSDPGNAWVNDLLSELRNFPNDTHDDQVDALTQALTHLRSPGKAQLSVPGRRAPAAAGPASRSISRAATTERRRLPSR